ncbi:MAG: hypothetical protein ACREQI_11845 [Candidatus Binataceae bacterium]
MPDRKISAADSAREPKSDSALARASVPAAPPLIRYSPATILFLIAILSAVDYTNSDLWGHLRFGAAMIANGGHVIRIDPYSYSIPHLPWIDHEWLSELLMAKAYAAMGAAGLKLIKLACAAATVIFLAAAVGETGAPIEIQGMVMLAAAVALTPQMEFRPQDFSYAFLSVVMALLARDNYRGRAPVWIVVPLMALWANLHGGFAAGLAAIAVYGAVAGTRDAIAGRGWGRGLRFGAIVAAAALMTLATPFGFGLWRSVAHTISRPRMLADIVEWQPLPQAMVAIWHRSAADRLFEAVFVAVLAGFAITVAIVPRGGDSPLVAVGVTMLYAAFSALRNLSLGLIGTAPALARHAALVAGRWNARGRAESGNRAARRRKGAGQTAQPGSAGGGTMLPAHASWLSEAAIAILAIAIFFRSGLFTERIAIARAEPQGAIAFMRANRLRGNILAAYAWNDYLLYHCLPGSHVFIDGRYETLYPNRIARAFEDFENDRPGAAALLKDYPHDFVLLPIHYAPIKLMSASPAWKLIYKDNVSMLYARADSPAAHLPGVPVTGEARTVTFP